MPHTLDPLESRTLFSALPAPVADAEPVAITNVGETPRINSDFNRDGYNDLFLRDLRVGFNNIQLMVDGEVVGELNMRSWGDTDWRAVGVADLTGDGRPDILFRNVETGQNRIWKMNGNVRIDEIKLPPANPNWRLGGLGDFNGDGHVDLMWRNTKTGQNTTWQMANSTFIRGEALPRLPNRQWTAAGVGDFTGDGRPDILFRNQATGANVVWRMNGSTLVRGYAIPPRDDADWQIGDVRDFDGDGDADVLLRNTATGQTEMWIMSRLQRAERQALPSYPANWQPPGTSVDALGSLNASLTL